MHYSWERLGDGVFRCRLPFLDVTVGLVHGSHGTLVVDTGSTRAEAALIASDVDELVSSAVTHVVLTHHHFDHVLGSSVFTDADVYAAPAAADVITSGGRTLALDAVSYGADDAMAHESVDALRAPSHLVSDAAAIDLGSRGVEVCYLGPAHTSGDLVVLVSPELGSTESQVVFCGDLVEESAEPAIDGDSDTAAWPATLDRLLARGGRGALYVPGHGSVVSAEFVAAQRDWLHTRR